MGYIAMLPEHGLKVVLVEPEIPQNAGNIARLCAAAGAELHLVRPLGFFLSDRHFKRAGMDYLQQVSLTVHEDLAALKRDIGEAPIILTSGLALQPRPVPLWKARFGRRDWIFFGKESGGLPGSLLAENPGAVVQIPMREGTRGLNVSTAAGIVVYEALRQISLL